MGLREKVTKILVIIALFQIACRHCMPRTPRKASLKRYVNDLKPVKNSPAPTPYSPSRLNKATKQTFGKTAQNGRINQNSLPKKSLYQTYKFPEMEFPLDNSPRDPFHITMNFNDNNHVSTLQKARNLQRTAINDLKKEMKMKRKLLSNKQINSENSPLKTEMSSIKFASCPDSMHLLVSESFPEVQYPLNTMDTWGPNYRSYLPLIQEKQCNGFGQQTLNRQTKDFKKPFTRLTKAEANKYLQSYDKLKEEQRRTSTENSKRSNAGQKGLNFTKTATCEKTSDDFMIAGLVSNIPSNPTELKRTLEPSTEIKASSENTCPITEYPNHYMPIPYRVIENSTENMCAFGQKNTTKELQDVDTSVIAQTLQLIEEILFHDDTSSAIPTGNYSKEIEYNVDSSDCTEVPANEDIPTTLKDKAKNFTDCPAEEISQEIPDDAPSDKMPSIPEEILADNFTAVEGPLSDRLPLQFSEPIEFEAFTNASERGRTIMAPITNSNAKGSTSIIIIPINNNFDGKSLPHILETTTGTPIIVYLPSTQNSDIPSQSQNQIVSSSLDNSLPNNELYNVLSNVAPVQNDNPSSTALVSELLNSISDSGSSLPMYETLPTNSMCYNNEISPSSIKEKPVSEILIHKSLTDDAPIRTTICEEKLPEQPTKSNNFVMNTENLQPTPDFEHPLFDFAGSEFSSMSHGPYNNVLKNELPTLTREINSYQQISNVASKDVFIPTENVTPEYLHTNISYDALPEIINDALTVAMNQSLSFETSTDSPPDPIIIDDIPSTHLTVTTVEKPLTIKTSFSLNPLSETLSDHSDSDKELMDMKVPPIPISTKDNTSSRSPVVNHYPMTTDTSIKTELFKIRQILDKMLSSETLPDSQTTPMVSILSPIVDTDSLPILVNESLEPTQTLNDSVFLPAVNKTVRPLPETDNPITSLGLQVHETNPSVPTDGTSSDTLPLPVDKSLIPSLLLDTTDSPPLLIDETFPSPPVFENPAGNKPYLINNLVIPLSETSTKYTPKNDLSRTTDDDGPSKMDLVIPNIHELLSDELLLPVDDSPIIVHEDFITNPKSEDSTKNLPTQMIEPQNSHSNVPVGDLLYITKKLSIPEMLEATLPDISSGSQTTTMSGYTNKIQQVVSPSIVLNSPENEKNQTFDLPLSIIPDMSSDAFANKPFLLDDSSSATNAKIGDFPHTNTDTKDLLSVEDHLLSPEDDSNPHNLAINSPSAVSLSTNLDKTNDEELSEYTLSDLPLDDLILTDDKILPLTDNMSTDLPLPINKTPTTSSKLSIAKALLKNVLSDITKGGFSSSVTRPPPVTPSSILKITTKYQVDVDSPPLEAKEMPLVEKIFPKSETSTNLTNPEKPEDCLPLLVDKAPSVSPILEIPTKDMHLKMNEIFTDKPGIKIDDIEKRFRPQERTETLLLEYPADDVLFPTDKVPLTLNTLDRNSFSNKNVPSESKLPITKAILENILSDITTKAFSLPTASKALPVKLSSVLDKTIYYEESPLSIINEECPSSVDKIIPSTILSDQPNDIHLPYSGQSEEILSLEVDKTFSEVSSLEISSEKTLMDKSDPTDQPNTKIHSSLPLFENVLSDVTSRDFSLPVSKILSVKSPSVLDKNFYYLESSPSDLTEENFSPSKEPSENEIISSTTYSYQPMDYNLPISAQSEDTLPLEDDKSLSSLNIPSETLMNDALLKSNDDMTSLKAKILPKETPSELPSSITKTLSSLKLPIAKALLQNVLSDVTSKSFSLPVSKVLPVKSSSVLDKNLNYMESSPSDLTEENFSSSEIPSENEIISSTTCSGQPMDYNLPISEQSEDTLPLEVYKSLAEVTSLHTPSETLVNKALLKSNVDMTSLKAEILPKETPSDLPSSITKTLSSSKLPIAKALLQNVLSDVTSKSFSLPVSKVLPVKSSSVLDETHYYVELPLFDPTEASSLFSVNDIISNTTFPHQPADNNLISGQSEVSLPLETFSEVSCLDVPSNMSSLMEKSNVEISSPKTEILPKDISSDPPLLTTKILSSSKLLITKALLENVLSDINTKGFSLPVAKSLPVESRSQLDKTLYFMDPPLSDFIEDSSRDNFPSSEINEDVFEQSLEKIFTENPNLHMHSEDLPVDQISDDRSDNLIENIEDEESNETFSNNPMDDTDDLPSQVDEQLSFSDNMSNDLPMPQHKR